MVELWGAGANLRKLRPLDVVPTPRYLFEILDQEFHFSLDVCALPENAKCRRYLTPEDDGLRQAWSGVCWMNPPYSQMKAWMEKAVCEWRKGCTIVCLVPVRSDQAWWHDYALLGEVRFIRGRVRFEGQKSGAPFPSALVVYAGAGGIGIGGTGV